MRTLAAWMRLHPDGLRQVRWTAAAAPESFRTAVLAAALGATPDDDVPFEEMDE
jgi:hypothetical protein